VASIKAKTFANATFERIFITNNKKLTKIDATAFNSQLQATRDLIIHHNEMLDGIQIFALTNIFKNSLVNVELNDNKITSIGAGVFDSFPNLESLRLDNQEAKSKTKTGLTIRTGAIKNLKNLKVLNLDGNKILSIEPKAIDLSGTEISEPHQVVIYLNNTEYEIPVTDIIIPPTKILNFNSFVVYLQGTKLKFEDGLIDNLANKGLVFLSLESTTKCYCYKIPNIAKILKNQQNIQGVFHHFKCFEKDENDLSQAMVTIDNCKPKTQNGAR
jgi:Leucine-rich repeat (LRR) protein